MTNFPKLYEGDIFIDERGIVGFNNNLELKNIKRFYTLENFSDNNIRAWHGHLLEEKYFLVVKGSAIIIACKLKEENDNFILSSDRTKVVLSEQKPSVFYIPAGYANGIKFINKETKILVLSTLSSEDSKKDDIRIKFDYQQEINMYPNNFEVIPR